MTFSLILSNNSNNTNLFDYSLYRLRHYDYIQEENIVSQTLRLETNNSVQQVIGTIVYNSNNTQTSLSKNSNIDYETSIQLSPVLINNLSNLLPQFCINIKPVDIYYNNVFYKCNKSVNINGETFYFLEQQ